MRRSFLSSMMVAALGFAGGCGPAAGTDRDGGGPPADADPTAPCVPAGDFDMDGISNQREGCLSDPARDTDGDGTPDWQDHDSDNDGVEDQWEDRNGDGQPGNCTTTCVDMSMCAAGFYCSLPIDGGGIGHCVSPTCLDGETDPHAVDTDGDGAPDGLEGTWVCRPADEHNPNGLKPIDYVDSAGAITYSTPNWKIALEVDAVDGPVTIAAPTSLDSAYVMDLIDPTAEVAGFIVSRAPLAGELNPSSGDPEAPSASQSGVSALTALGTAVQRASGTRNMSLDGYDTVLSTTVTLATGSTDVTLLRNQVMAALLARAPGDLTIPPVGWSGSPATSFAVVFQTLVRTDPPEVIYMGAVASLAQFDDVSQSTGFHVDDLANGTGLAESANGEAIECEQFLVAEVPKADIIWVMDESGSMDDDRANVAANATSFFTKAVLAGLDFRIAVTDMDNARGGLFSSRSGASTTGDRWLLPSEIATFQAGINDPSGPDPGDGGAEDGLTNGDAAIARHLPRSDVDFARFRPDAKLVLIYATDEHAEEIETAGIIGDGQDPANATQKAQIAALAQPYVNRFTVNDGVAHLIGIGESSATCSSLGEISYGYLDLITATGGQFGAICQPDLGPTMDAIIDDVVGAASPIRLEFVPISATIAVARDNLYVPRSRSSGWDYRASSNSIIFNNMPFDPLSPSEVVVSYRRWQEQVPIE